MELRTMEFAVADGIATITLKRPDAANALDLRMSEEILSVASHCDSNRAIRAVILTGHGKMFCAGGDVMSFAAAGDGVSEMMRNMTAFLHAAVARFLRMNAPLVTAVNGAAAGAGLSIALMGDIILAAQSAKFTMAYTKIGVTPDGSSTFTLPRLVGMARAKEMILMNPVYTAEEAAAKGLVTMTVSDDQLMARAREIATRLAQGPTKAYGEAKRLLADSFSNTLETQMEMETRAIAGLSAYTHDAREGFTSFAEKRKPRFEGC